MPHHDHFKKSIRQDKKRNLRNRAAKSRLRTMIKKIRSAENKEKAVEVFKVVVPLIDTTARKGIMKKTTAARVKSRLHKFVTNMA